MAINKIGWGILGCGNIGPFHAQALRSVDQAELVQVCDIVEEKAQKVADEHDCSYCTSYDELLANDDIQAIYLSSRLGGSTVELPLSYEDDGPGIYPTQAWPEW